MKTLYKLSLILIFVLSSAIFVAAQSEREKAIALFNQGDYQNAASGFKKITAKNSGDITAWHYLGLTFEKLGKPDKAEKAFETAVDKTIGLIEQNLEEKFAKKEIYKKQTNAEFLKPRIGAEIDAALESSKRITESYSKNSFSKAWETRNLILKMFEEKMSATDAPATDNNSNTGQNNGTVITKKPFAGYTNKAREHGTSGRISLFVQFLSNGEIGLVVPLNRLPDGLTEEAIAAARGIKFQPQVKDGIPVNAFKQVEYSFSIY